MVETSNLQVEALQKEVRCSVQESVAAKYSLLPYGIVAY